MTFRFTSGNIIGYTNPAGVLDHASYYNEPFTACGAPRTFRRADDVAALVTCLTCLRYPLPTLNSPMAIRTTHVSLSAGDTFQLTRGGVVIVYEVHRYAVGPVVVLASGAAVVEMDGVRVPLRPRRP